MQAGFTQQLGQLGQLRRPVPGGQPSRWVTAAAAAAPRGVGVKADTHYQLQHQGV